MKILIITNHSYMLYRFRKELIQKLHASHEVVLSMPFVGHEQDFMDMGIRCIQTEVARREIRPTNELKLLCTYLRMILTEKPDCVITYSIKPNIYAGLCCRIFRVPYYVTVQGLGTALHSPKLEKAATMLYKQALRRAEAVFFENEANAELFRTRKIIPACKQVLLSGAGINLDEYTPSPDPQNDAFRFLYLGRIMPEKGINELLTAAKELYSKYGKKVQLDIVGFYDSDDLAVAIQEAEALGAVVFHGFQTDPRPYYAQTDCVVVPSYHEGMNNVLLEGAAMEKPLITTDVPGCRESVEDGVNGLLCQAKDSKSLYDCMEKMLLMPKDARTSMGKASRRRMEQIFDRQKVVSQVLHVIERKGGERK